MRYDCAFAAMNRLGCGSRYRLLGPSARLGTGRASSRSLFQRVVSLKIINNADAGLKPLCAASERFFHCSAEDDRDFRKALGNADAHPVIPSVAIFKIDGRFVSRVDRPGLRKN